MNKNIGILRLTPETLLGALGLPPDVDVRNATVDLYGNVCLTVSHPEIPETLPGGQYPWVFPQFTASVYEFKGRGVQLRTEHSSFTGWKY